MVELVLICPGFYSQQILQACSILFQRKYLYLKNLVWGARLSWQSIFFFIWFDMIWFCRSINMRTGVQWSEPMFRKSCVWWRDFAIPVLESQRPVDFWGSLILQPSLLWECRPVRGPVLKRRRGVWIVSEEWHLRLFSGFRVYACVCAHQNPPQHRKRSAWSQGCLCVRSPLLLFYFCSVLLSGQGLSTT